MTEELRNTSQKVIKKLCKELMAKCNLNKEKAQSVALLLEESVVRRLTCDQNLLLEQYKAKIIELFNNLAVSTGLMQTRVQQLQNGEGGA